MTETDEAVRGVEDEGNDEDEEEDGCRGRKKRSAGRKHIVAT